MKTIRIPLLILLLGLLAVPLSQAGESGQAVANTDLKSEPFTDAKTVGTLNAKAAVDVIKRQGGWLQVKSADGTSGWVKMTGIKLDGSGVAKSGDSGLANAISVAQTGRSGNTGVTVATGVRGLTPDDLKNAKPDPDAVKKLDSYTAGKSEAESFARSANISKHTVAYLEGANTTTSASSSPSSAPGPRNGFFGGPGK